MTLPENVYECLFILDANAYARDPGGAAVTIEKLVNGCDGEILASRLWNEQKLAYPIKGRHKGAYWLSYLRLETEAIAKFNRSCQLTDIILRHMAIKIDPRLVQPLVAAATGSAVDSSESSDDQEVEEKEAVTEAAGVDG